MKVLAIFAVGMSLWALYDLGIFFKELIYGLYNIVREKHK